jgi:zinc transporter ZupT
MPSDASRAGSRRDSRGTLLGVATVGALSSLVVAFAILGACSLEDCLDIGLALAAGSLLVLAVVVRSTLATEPRKKAAKKSRR